MAQKQRTLNRSHDITPPKEDTGFTEDKSSWPSWASKPWSGGDNRWNIETAFTSGWWSTGLTGKKYLSGWNAWPGDVPPDIAHKSGDQWMSARITQHVEAPLHNGFNQASELFVLVMFGTHLWTETNLKVENLLVGVTSDPDPELRSGGEAFQDFSFQPWLCWSILHCCFRSKVPSPMDSDLLQIFASKLAKMPISSFCKWGLHVSTCYQSVSLSQISKIEAIQNPWSKEWCDPWRKKCPILWQTLACNHVFPTSDKIPEQTNISQLALSLCTVKSNSKQCEKPSQQARILSGQSPKVTVCREQQKTNLSCNSVSQDMYVLLSRKWSTVRDSTQRENHRMLKLRSIFALIKPQRPS